MLGSEVNFILITWLNYEKFMRKYIDNFSIIVLAWCWRNVEIKDEKLPLNDEIINEEKLVKEEITNNDSLKQEEFIYEDLPLNTEFQPSISKNWVYFYKNPDLNRPHYFLTDKKVIRDNSDYTNFVKKFHYVFAPITINETTYTDSLNILIQVLNVKEMGMCDIK